MRLAVVWLVIVVLAFAPPAWCGRPLDTEDTDVLEASEFEVELGVDALRSARDDAWALRGVLAAGLLPRLQAEVEVPFLLLDPEGARWRAGPADVVLLGKYRLVDERETVPALAGAVALRLPTGDVRRGLGDEGVDVMAVGILGKTLGPVVLHGNVGYTFVTADRALDFWTLAASIEYRVTERLALVAEALGFLGVRRARRDTGLVRGGVTYRLRERLKLDAAIGHEIADDHLLVRVGVTIGF